MCQLKRTVCGIVWPHHLHEPCTPERVGRRVQRPRLSRSSCLTGETGRGQQGHGHLGKRWSCLEPCSFSNLQEPFDRKTKSPSRKGPRRHSGQRQVPDVGIIGPPVEHGGQGRTCRRKRLGLAACSTPHAVKTLAHAAPGAGPSASNPRRACRWRTRRP